VSEIIARNGSFLVSVAPGARVRDALRTLSAEYPSLVNFPQPPIDLVNFGVAAGTLLVAKVLAVVPALVASRARPASILRAE
jgi:hypothetical protein